MTFIRAKKIKGKEYAYLIQNKWIKTKKRPKQKVIGYLGKIITPELKNNMKETSFFDFKKIHEPEEYIENNTKEQILLDLIKFEIAKHEIDIKLNFEECSLNMKNKNIVLKINEGFMCQHTLKELKALNPKGEEEEVGLELAKGFVNAGIKIPSEIFIGFFSKIFKLDNINDG